MPKQTKSSTAKVRRICEEYPDEFSATPAGDLRCNLCDVLVKCDKKFNVESLRKSKQYQGKLETTIKSQSMQTFLQLDQVNFREQVVSSFLAADIPLHKLNHPSLSQVYTNHNCKLNGASRFFKPGLHDTQLQVEWSVTFLYSLVVERHC